MTTPPPLAIDDLPEQMRVRRRKRERMLSTGPHPYPVGVPRTRTLREIRDAYDGLAPDVGTG
ncbi:MAG: lysine--tRNA ligase, partial [Pseudonocardiaceae bacterium]